MSNPSRLSAYERANQSFERTLDDLREQLLAVFDGADGWIECLLLSFGFFLLSTGRASMQHIEAGFVTLEPGELAAHAIPRVIALALTVHLVQRWALTRLRYNVIDARFGQVAAHLEAAKEELIESYGDFQQGVQSAQEKLFEMVDLPSLEWVFDGKDPDRDPFQDFGRPAEVAALDAAALIDRRIAEFDPGWLAQWYPPELMTQARLAAMDVERLRVELLNQREAVSISSESLSSYKPSSGIDDRVAAALAERDNAIKRLGAARAMIDQQREALLRAKQVELEAVRIRLKARVSEVNVFRRLAKVNTVMGVSIVSFIAMLTFASIWLPPAR